MSEGDRAPNGAAPDAEDTAEVTPRDCDGEPSVLTVDELATLLRVERKTVYAAIARGELPGVRRVGRSLRISREAVLGWLARGHVRGSRPRRAK
jgi:excisionase family DNA binding protein